MNNAQYLFKDENADIRRYALFQIVKQVGLTVLWIICGIIGMAIYLSDPLSIDPTDKMPTFIVVSIIYVALPFLFFKPHRLLTNGNWTGTVGRKFMKTKMIDPGVTAKRLVEKQVMSVEFIRDSDGKVFTYDFYDNLYFVGQDYYKTGEKIRHYRGIKYPYKQRRPEDKYCVCIVCGSRALADDTQCGVCRRTLLK